MPCQTTQTAADAPGVCDAASGRADGPRCLAVMYHYVHDHFAGCESIDRAGLGVRAIGIREFEAQLDQLTTRLEPIDWPGLSSGLRSRTELPDRSFLLTFDDGLREHAEIVIPILQRKGLKGLFFVPGSTMAGKTVLTAHAVHLLLEALGSDRLAGELKGLLSTMNAATELTPEEQNRAADVYHYETQRLAELKFLINMKLPLAVRASVIRRLFESHLGPQSEWAARWYMNADQVRDIHAGGHAIGGHSYAHEPYHRLDEPSLARDINRCSVALREVLGPGERPFAFPFGSVHPSAAKYLGAAGFRGAFGTTPEWMTPGSPASNLPRVDTIHVNAQLQEQSA